VARPENTGLEKDFYMQDDVPESEVVENLFAEFENTDRTDSRSRIAFSSVRDDRRNFADTKT
jgi:hypothetical protein